MRKIILEQKILRAQNVGEKECRAEEFILYSLNNGDPGKSFEKESDTFRFV